MAFEQVAEMAIGEVAEWVAEMVMEQSPDWVAQYHRLMNLAEECQHRQFQRRAMILDSVVRL